MIILLWLSWLDSAVIIYSDVMYLERLLYCISHQRGLSFSNRFFYIIGVSDHMSVFGFECIADTVRHLKLSTSAKHE